MSGLKGLDISDIEVVVQWHVPDSLCTLMQWFGQAAHNQALTGTAILLAEPSVFQGYKDKKVQRQMAQAAKKAMESSEGKTMTHAGPGSLPKLTQTGSTPRFLHPEVWEQKVIENALDEFVNEDCLPLNCQRHVSDQHFGNNKLREFSHCLMALHIPMADSLDSGRRAML